MSASTDSQRQAFSQKALLERLAALPLPIQAKQNEHFRELLQWGRRGAYADAYLAEGVRLLSALPIQQAERYVQCLLLSPAGLKHFDDPVYGDSLKRLFSLDRPLFYLSDTLLNRLTETEHSQGIALLLERPDEHAWQHLLGEQRSPLQSRLLILENVQDPGNVGTLLRLALALGWDGVLLCGSQACNPFQGKVLRASMGAVWQLPCYRLSCPDEASLQKFYQQLKQVSCTLIATSPHAPIDVRHVLEQPPIRQSDSFALLLGNEAKGLSQLALNMADLSVSIPMWGAVESLNVATAATIAAWELSRLQPR